MNSLLVPCEYTFAVSIKLMPSSSARLMTSRVVRRVLVPGTKFVLGRDWGLHSCLNDCCPVGAHWLGDMHLRPEVDEQGAVEVEDEVRL